MSDLVLQRSLVISDPVRSYNEDIGGVLDGAAWTLDGATGVTDDTYMDAPSDGHWYVDQFDSYLREHVRDTSKSLTEHVADGIVTIRDKFDDVAPVGTIDAAAEPSATGAIVRWHDTTLEYYVLCDSTFLLLEGADLVARETDRRIAEIEQRVRQEARALKQQGLTLEDARQRVMPSLRENRRQKNTENSYWVLSFDPDAAKRGLSGQYELGPDSSVYLFTDGFARLVSVYDVSPDWETAITDIHRSGVESAVDTLRCIERNDPDGDDYFRLKQSDDTTVVKLTFGPG